MVADFALADQDRKIRLNPWSIRLLIDKDKSLTVLPTCSNASFCPIRAQRSNSGGHSGDENHRKSAIESKNFMSESVDLKPFLCN